MTESATPPAHSPSKIPPFRYTALLAADIESRWRHFWETNGTFHTPNPAGPLADPERLGSKPKSFIVDMFPYPSGSGLHVGHPLGYIGTDVYARFKRMKGYNVLHALGYDSFGLPAEQHAITTGIHPRINTESNITNMRRQLRRLGLGHDPRRSVSTTDEEFYKWTQWIFLQVHSAWFDETQNKARPITELINEFTTGVRPAPGEAPWSELTPSQRHILIDNYRLAYLADAPVNWCPGLGTILANEEVTADGRSDIGNYPVFRRNMRQWMMRITSYADRLVDDLDRLDWPEPIKLMQRNWINRSYGARVTFATTVEGIDVFTTRPDTLFGATFLVLSPEHPLVSFLTTDQQRNAVEQYCALAATRQDNERQDDSKQKTGVPTGSFATNPVNGAQIPIYIADYVLMGYGTGAIMAVPSGDQRDFEFARAYGLPIVATAMPPDSWFEQYDIAPSVDCSTWPSAFTSDGVYIDSANESVSLNGLTSIDEATTLIVEWLNTNNHGQGTTTYRLRDWLFSRQRYWGEPFPIVYDDEGNAHAVPEKELPVLLPELADFKPTALDPNDAQSDPIPPLARIADWMKVTLDLGDGPRTYRREVNVMPQWAGSCWYEMRYLDPTNTERFVDKEVERYWMGPDHQGHTGGVDLYVGGVEHAVLHLLYSRFWHKVLFDLGHVSSQEPFHRLFNQGYIQAYAFRDERGQAVTASEVTESNGSYMWNNEPVTREYGKMGKSLKNIVTPDEMYDEFGADTFRLYEMAMGPLDASRPWNTRDVVGMQRFLQRLWRNIVNEDTGQSIVTNDQAPEELVRHLHRTILGVDSDMDGLRFNTVIAKLIEFNNALTQYVTVTQSSPREVIEPLVQMLSPLCPHAAEELWALLGHSDSITYVEFPVANPDFLIENTIEIPVQINGKVRGRIVVGLDADQETLLEMARAIESVALALEGKTIVKTVVVPGRMVNIVVK